MARGRLQCVLIIDDDPIHRELMSSFLSKRSVARILTAANGSEARRLVETDGSSIDLMLCDLNMPDFDGVEFIMYLAERQLRCDLLIISGADASVTKAASRLATSHRLNLKGFLRKPVDFKQLGAMLENTGTPP